MKGYFIYTNDQQQGPFSILELKELGINQGTPIWKEGFDTWKKAGEVEELNSCFTTVPPPYSASSQNTNYKYAQPVKTSPVERAGRKVGKLLAWVGIIILVIIVAGFIYNKTAYSAGTYTTTPPPDPEQYNPSAYLNANGTYRKNFWGDKITINGKVTNSATHTNYKDVYITVKFYSKTKSVIDSKTYVLYDYFPYGMAKDFELKVGIPSNMETCGWEATSATAF